MGHPALLDPWDMAAIWGRGTVIAVLTGTEGPAYRNPGATLAVAPDGRFAGAITSGCVEADLILRAAEVRRTGRTQTLRYGMGSPFFDLKLPCGGGIDVRLFLPKDPAILLLLQEARANRKPVALAVGDDGSLKLEDWRPTAGDEEAFHLGFRPGPQFVVFGTGAEAAAFTGLLRGMGHNHLALSHELSTLAAISSQGSQVQEITPQARLQDLPVDADTAIVLFYHDHDFERVILRQMLRSSAFYIGAQGSRATQARRLETLAAMGVPAEALSRLRGPIGLIPSSRDPQTLALSVLAQIVDVHAGLVK
ncbi:xanthine dehydrogenase accessory factor [Rhodobacter sp. 24-YEA-8]|nr:xanthine dehydrogenase accessory factor [Rhodobacter sp. 24-YEA-8]